MFNAIFFYYGNYQTRYFGQIFRKVFTVTRSSWNGISYMREHAKKFKNPRTERQMEQRSKFAIMHYFLKPITPFVRTGFKAHASKQKAFNAAMSYIVNNATIGAFPNYALDFSHVLVLRGSLTQPAPQR